MPTTFTVEPVSAQELDKILRSLIEAGSEVDRISMATSLVLDNFDRESGRVLKSGQIGHALEVEDLPELAGSFDAEAAWHLHRFAVDVERAAENITEWAHMIDRAAHRLYEQFHERGDDA